MTLLLSIVVFLNFAMRLARNERAIASVDLKTTFRGIAHFCSMRSWDRTVLAPVIYIWGLKLRDQPKIS